MSSALLWQNKSELKHGAMNLNSILSPQTIKTKLLWHSLKTHEKSSLVCKFRPPRIARCVMRWELEAWAAHRTRKAWADKKGIKPVLGWSCFERLGCFKSKHLLNLLNHFVAGEMRWLFDSSFNFWTNSKMILTKKFETIIAMLSRNNSAFAFSFSGPPKTPSKRYENKSRPEAIN